MSKLRGVSKRAEFNIKLHEIKKMNQYSFTIDRDKEGKYILKCERIFEYKGQKHSAVTAMMLNQYEEGQKIPKQLQDEMIAQVNKEINNFKINN